MALPVTILALSLLPVPIDATPEGREIIARSAAVKALVGEFEEERRHPFLREALLNEGRFAFSAGELHWRTERPAPAYFRYRAAAPRFEIYYADEARVELYPTELLADWRVLLGSRLEAMLASGIRVFLGGAAPGGRAIILVRGEEARGARLIAGVVDPELGVLREVSWRSRRGGPVTIRFREARTLTELPSWCREPWPEGVRREVMGGGKKP